MCGPKARGGEAQTKRLDRTVKRENHEETVQSLGKILWLSGLGDPVESMMANVQLRCGGELFPPAVN